MKAKPKKVETTKTSVRVPKRTWDQIKILAIDTGYTAQELIKMAIHDLLAKNNRERAAWQRQLNKINEKGDER